MNKYLRQNPDSRDIVERVNTLVNRQAENITSLTDSTGGTANNTLTAISGSGADAAINNNFADLAAKVNEILTALQNAKLMK